MSGNVVFIFGEIQRFLVKS